jgi:hypothetical protein
MQCKCGREMTTRLAVNKKFDNRLEYQECNGCKRLGSELYFDVQATFGSKKEAQSGVLDMEKVLQKEFKCAKKVPNSDRDNKPTWLQAEWKTNKNDEDDKPCEAFISIEVKI